MDLVENINIRLLNESEIDALHALRQEVLRKPLGMDLFQEDLSAETEQIKIGALLNNQLIACLMLKVSNDSAKLRQMAVKPEFQGMGIGQAVVKFAEKYCLDNTILKIELHSRENALGFYEGMDYEIIGDEFLEVGLPHYKMIKVLRNNTN